MNTQTIVFEKRVTLPPVSTSSTCRAHAFIIRKPFLAALITAVSVLTVMALLLTTLMLIQNRMRQTQKTTQFWQAYKNGEDPAK